MLLAKVKEAIKKKSEDSYKLPDDETLANIVHEASLYVCSLCEPSELIRKDNVLNDKEHRVFRHIENGLFIKVPEYPDFSKEMYHLQMDEALTYAVIYYACFIISKQKDMNFKALANETINIYRSNFANVRYGECR